MSRVRPVVAIGEVAVAVAIYADDVVDKPNVGSETISTSDRTMVDGANTKVEDILDGPSALVKWLTRDHDGFVTGAQRRALSRELRRQRSVARFFHRDPSQVCLLYTSDAADDLLC